MSRQTRPLIINGKNAKTEYGIVLVEGAYKELWKFPKAKTGYEYNWNDSNGVETDPDAKNYFERLEYSVPLLLTSSSAADFWSKVNAWYQFIVNTRYITLDIPDRQRRFELVNKGVDNYEDFNTDSKPFATLTWLLANDKPNEVLKIV